MNTQTAIDFAAKHLAVSDISTEGYIPVVVAPAERETEVTFPVDSEHGGGAHRIFLDAYGDFLGLVLADGSVPDYCERSAQVKMNEEDSLAAATRFLDSHGVDTDGLVPERVEPSRLVHVWHRTDSDEDVMGAGPEVYLTDCGIIVRSYTAQ